MLNNLL